MTSRPQPQCLSCVHWVPPLNRPDATQTCVAFPGGIPDAILENRADHRIAIPGDGGRTWAPYDDAEFPEWALQDRAQ